MFKKIILISIIFVWFLPLKSYCIQEKIILQVFTHPKVYFKDMRLIKAIIKIESNNCLYNLSDKGAVGCMQVKPSTSRYVIKIYQIKRNINLKNAYDNVLIGVLYLQYLKGRWGNGMFLYLAAYNAGETPLKYWLKHYFIKDYDYNYWIRYKETRDYITKIMRLYKIEKV
jgi:soluble lytic murein transglycosylase